MAPTTPKESAHQRVAPQQGHTAVKGAAKVSAKTSKEDIHSPRLQAMKGEISTTTLPHPNFIGEIFGLLHHPLFTLPGTKSQSNSEHDAKPAHGNSGHAKIVKKQLGKGVELRVHEGEHLSEKQHNALSLVSRVDRHTVAGLKGRHPRHAAAARAELKEGTVSVDADTLTDIANVFEKRGLPLDNASVKSFRGTAPTDQKLSAAKKDDDSLIDSVTAKKYVDALREREQKARQQKLSAAKKGVIPEKDPPSDTEIAPPSETVKQPAAQEIVTSEPAPHRQPSRPRYVSRPPVVRRTQNFEHQSNTQTAAPASLDLAGGNFQPAVSDASISNEFRAAQLSATSARGLLLVDGENGRLHEQGLGVNLEYIDAVDTGTGTRLPHLLMGRGVVVESFRMMCEAAARDGVTLTLSGSYRTLERQIELKAEKGHLAATPGSSDHGWARAVDVDNRNVAAIRWLEQFGQYFGWKQLPNERWHFTFYPQLVSDEVRKLLLQQGNEQPSEPPVSSA